MDRLLKSIIMAVIGDIDKPVPTLLGMGIHNALGIKSRYREWIKRTLKRVVLVEGVDCVFFEQTKKKRSGRAIKHVRLTIDAAKRVILASGSPKAYALVRKIDDYMVEYLRPADTSTKNDEPKPDPEPIVVAKTVEGFVQVFKYDFFSIYNFQMVDGRAGLSKFEGVHRVRVVPLEFEPWFVAEDIAVVLWFNKEHRLFRMVEGLRHRTCTIKGNLTYLIDKQSIDIAVALSRNPDKHNFQPWIEGTVVPDFYAKMGYGPKPAPEPKPEPKVEVVDEPEEAQASSWITDSDNQDVIFDDYSEDDDEGVALSDTLPDETEPETHTPPNEEKPDMNMPVFKAYFFDKTRSVKSIKIDDKPWFVANDLCKLLGYANTSGPVKHLRNRYKKKGLDVNSFVRFYPIPNKKGFNPQDTNILSEKAAHDLVSHCRKKNAFQVRKWIESEVIPSCRNAEATHTEPSAKDEDHIIKEEPVINPEPIKETETMKETPVIDQDTSEPQNIQEVIVVGQDNIEGQMVETFNIRAMYEYLGVGRDFSSWVKYQIERGRFIKNRDYVVFTNNGVNPTGGLTKNGEASSAALSSNKIEYHFTIEAGKHIAMMSNTEKGRDVRDYFIQCEKIAKQDEPETHTPSEEKSDMNLPVCQSHFYNNGRAVRSVTVNGNPWFVAKDVCDLVDVVNHKDAVGTLRSNYESIGVDMDWVVLTYPILDAMGRLRDTIILSEAATYDLILQSRKPEALKIKYWVTSEVMPSIRKTGGYGTPAPTLDMNDPVSRMEHMVRQAEMIITMANNQKLLTEKVETITQEKEVLNESLARISETEGSYKLRDAATTLNLHQNDLVAYLYSIGWTYRANDPRDDHKPQEQRRSYWAAYTPIINRGWMEHVERKVTNKKTGKVNYWPQARVTHKGMVELTRRLVKSNLKPLNPNKPLGMIERKEA